ncbi:hypothetical protein QTP70_022060, partial [Hemibagrus guttatus]
QSGRWPALFDATQINDEFKRITTINLESTFMAKLDHCTQKLMDVVSSRGGASGDSEEFEASLERQVMKIAIIGDRSTPAFDHWMATILVENKSPGVKGYPKVLCFADGYNICSQPELLQGT